MRTRCSLKIFKRGNFAAKEVSNSNEHPKFFLRCSIFPFSPPEIIVLMNFRLLSSILRCYFFFCRTLVLKTMLLEFQFELTSWCLKFLFQGITIVILKPKLWREKKSLKKQRINLIIFFLNFMFANFQNNKKWNPKKFPQEKSLLLWSP